MKVVPTPNIFNSQYISAEWPVNFEKNAFEILHSVYILVGKFVCQRRCGLVGYAPLYHADDPYSSLTRPSVFIYLFY